SNGFANRHWFRRTRRRCCCRLDGWRWERCCCCCCCCCCAWRPGRLLRSGWQATGTLRAAASAAAAGLFVATTIAAGGYGWLLLPPLLWRTMLRSRFGNNPFRCSPPMPVITGTLGPGKKRVDGGQGAAFGGRGVGSTVHGPAS
ncbi:unnamed protein product, partial [Ectocarpus sp. 12 AP-2014]